MLGASEAAADAIPAPRANGGSRPNRDLGRISLRLGFPFFASQKRSGICELLVIALGIAYGVGRRHGSIGPISEIDVEQPCVAAPFR